MISNLKRLYMLSWDREILSHSPERHSNFLWVTENIYFHSCPPSIKYPSFCLIIKGDFFFPQRLFWLSVSKHFFVSLCLPPCKGVASTSKANSISLTLNHDPFLPSQRSYTFCCLFMGLYISIPSQLHFLLWQLSLFQWLLFFKRKQDSYLSQLHDPSSYHHSDFFSHYLKNTYLLIHLPATFPMTTQSSLASTLLTSQ